MNRDEHIRKLWREASRRYRINHKEEIRQLRKQQYKENAEHNRKVRRFWYHKNKEIEDIVFQKQHELDDTFGWKMSTKEIVEKLRQELREKAKKEMNFGN